MSTLFVALACAIALVALPHLLVMFAGNLARSCGMLFSMLFTAMKKCFISLFKGIVWVFKIPLNVAKEFIEACQVWKTLFKKGVDSNKKQHAFKQAVKNKNKRNKLANQYDEVFYEANSALMTLKANQSDQGTCIENDNCELDSPTFLRKKIFQTNNHGALRRDDFGFPIKTTVASMFSQPESIEDQETVTVSQSTESQTVNTNEYTDSSFYIDEEGFEPEFDPSLDVLQP